MDSDLFDGLEFSPQPKSNRTKKYLFGGDYVTLREISKRSECVVGLELLRKRIAEGWTVEEAATVPKFVNKESWMTREQLKICSRADVCPVEKCSHKVPHKGFCGVPMPCHDDPSGAISHCVTITNGEYEVKEHGTCKCCGGSVINERVIKVTSIK